MDRYRCPRSAHVSFTKYRGREGVNVIPLTLILPHQYFMDLIDFRAIIVWEIILSAKHSRGC